MNDHEREQAWRDLGADLERHLAPSPTTRAVSADVYSIRHSHRPYSMAELEARRSAARRANADRFANAVTGVLAAIVVAIILGAWLLR